MMEKLKISAVICEFNPLHMGHKLLLDQMKAISDGIVCVMSGNFVQRGEPAILDPPGSQSHRTPHRSARFSPA